MKANSEREIFDSGKEKFDSGKEICGSSRKYLIRKGRFIGRNVDKLIT